MSSVQITVTKRDTNVKPRDIRQSGKIPAVVYGSDMESTPIEFDYQEFRKAYKKTGNSTIMTLMLDGEEVDTLVHSVDYEPVSDDYIHIDFLAIKRGELIKAHIPIHTTGLAPAVKNLLGSLITPLSEVEVECLPRFLIKDITVDVSHLETFHDAIHVSDLEIAKNDDITILTDLESVIATVSPPKGGSNTDEEETEEEGKEEPKEKSE